MFLRIARLVKGKKGFYPLLIVFALDLTVDATACSDYSSLDFSSLQHATT